MNSYRVEVTIYNEGGQEEWTEVSIAKTMPAAKSKATRWLFDHTFYKADNKREVNSHYHVWDVEVNEDDASH